VQGGGIYNPRGKSIVAYSWLLLIFSHNLETKYGLYKGLKISLSHNIQNTIVNADSLIINKHMVKGINSLDVKLDLILSQLKHLINSFFDLKFYHVFIGNKIEADRLASQESTQKKWDLSH